MCVLQTYIFICMGVCIKVHIHVCVSIYINIYICSYMYLYIKYSRGQNFDNINKFKLILLDY